MPSQQEYIFTSEARTRGGAERSLNTHIYILLSLRIGKDLSSWNVDLISPLSLSLFPPPSPTLPTSLALFIRSLLLSSPLSRQNLPPPPPPTTHCCSAKDHLDEEQYDHRWGPQVSDAEQTRRVDSEYPQAVPVWWGQILLQGHQRPRGRPGGVQAGGPRYAARTSCSIKVVTIP